VEPLIPLPTEVTVVKRDGRREPFVPEKLVVSALKAGAPPDVARKIAIIVTARVLERGAKEVSARELTRWMLELLRRENEEWYRNWIVFDRAVKRRRTEEELKQEEKS
jgi:transcriptional regulator NrdR family protein